ncbi:MAG: hypothetical protein A2081_01995 [Elusimicrobia bacterium GWC2_61_19]|nr:MAG: hypothetical protein A2081_01995 [Elusimicrobia bacterium GWC2_61_19]
MEKQNVAKQGKGALYLFSGLFTGFLLFSFVVDGWLSTGWWVRTLENKWADFRINLPALVSLSSEQDLKAGFGKYFNHDADDRIFVAAIDEHTVKKLGYPFKRKNYATLIEKLNKAGVKAIGLDVLIFDSDRDDKVSDGIMVDAVRRAANVSVLVAVNPETGEVQYPISGLGEAAKYISHPHVEGNIEANGEVRRLSLFSDSILYKNLSLKTKCGKDCAGVGLPLLAMAVYSGYSGRPLADLENEYRTAPHYLNFRIPQDRVYHPGWTAPPAKKNNSVYRHISVLDIMEGKLSPEERKVIKGGIALVGSTALGAYDHYPSPFYASWPGVEVHANAIDNMLHGDFLHPVATWIIVLLAVLLVWLPVVLSRYSIKVISITSVSVMAALMALSVYAMTQLTAMPYLSLLFSLMVPFIFVTVHKAVLEGREKKWIKNTFGQYLSPKVVELITKDPSRLSLGGEKREMTAFFLDIAGFTTMSEKMTPEELTSMLNEYLSGLTDIILKHDGVVDKYIGDCIMAFWNAPLDQKDHRRLACLAAVDCQAEMARLNKQLTQYAIKPSCRVGLNSGPMVVGNMGSKTRLSYTVMGDAVNLASRLEGANKFFHSQIMASGETFEDSKELFDHRFLGSIRVVGKAIPVKVYEPFARKGAAGPEIAAMLKSYGEGTEKFYAGKYADAAKLFKAALKARPADGPSQFYLELAEKYEKEVPKDWDGSFNLTSK